MQPPHDDTDRHLGPPSVQTSVRVDDGVGVCTLFPYLKKKSVAAGRSTTLGQHIYILAHHLGQHIYSRDGTPRTQ